MSESVRILETAVKNKNRTTRIKEKIKAAQLLVFGANFLQYDSAKKGIFP